MDLTEILIGTDWTDDISSMILRSIGGSNGETLFYFIEDQSNGAGPDYIDYVESVIGGIDAAIDLDFKRTYDWQEGFYDINLYDKNSTDNTVGKITTRADNLQIAVFMRDAKDTSSNRNTFLHEFLHGLGLGEPGWDERYDQMDTALSYNLGKAEDWRNQPSAFDSQMLLALWGPENDSVITALSPELINSVGRLYTAAFGRVPDQSGVNYWSNIINDSILNYQGVAHEFVKSDEFASRFGVNNSNQQFVFNLYSNVLGRAPEAEGLIFWTSLIDTNQINRSDVLVGFANSAENVLLYNSIVA